MWLLFVVFLWINRLSKGKGILHLLKISPSMAKSFYFNEKHVKKAFLKNALSLIVFTHVAHKTSCLQPNLIGSSNAGVPRDRARDMPSWDAQLGWTMADSTPTQRSWLFDVV